MHTATHNRIVNQIVTTTCQLTHQDDMTWQQRPPACQHSLPI